MVATNCHAKSPHNWRPHPANVGRARLRKWWRLGGASWRDAPDTDADIHCGLPQPPRSLTQVVRRMTLMFDWTLA